MLDHLKTAADWLVGPEAPAETPRTHLLPRWIFLRALGVIYFSAFYSLIFQIRGLIGPQGIFKPAVLPEMPLSITTVPIKLGQARPYED